MECSVKELTNLVYHRVLSLVWGLYGVLIIFIHWLIVRHSDTTAVCSAGVCGFTEGLLENFIELFVVWLLLELQVENLVGKLLHYLGVVTAKVIQSVILLCFSSKLKSLGVDHMGIEVDTGQLALVQHVDGHVEEGDKIVSAAGFEEVKLVKASKDHVASEGLNFFL